MYEMRECQTVVVHCTRGFCRYTYIYERNPTVMRICPNSEKSKLACVTTSLFFYTIESLPAKGVIGTKKHTVALTCTIYLSKPLSGCLAFSNLCIIAVAQN